MNIDHMTGYPYSGLIQYQIDHVTYNVSPIDVLDENLFACLESHKAELLEVRAYLYDV